jgi:hypothetical protein
MQLGESRTRDHPPDRMVILVKAETLRSFGQGKEDRTLPLHQLSHRAVIDDLMPDRV